jgi:multidrug efflux pump subunit AcrA (membrane-fusion protein)
MVEPLSSQVRAVSDRIDPKTRTYAIRVPLEDSRGTIKAGAFVRADIEPAPRLGALLVPRQSIARREGRTYLFRTSNGVAERVAVRVGVVGRDEAEILSGIALEDQIIVGDVVSRLTDGDPIRVVGPVPLQAQRESPSGEGLSAEEGSP